MGCSRPPAGRPRARGASSAGDRSGQDGSAGGGVRQWRIALRRPAGASALGRAAPIGLLGALNPAISITPFGKAYLAFTADRRRAATTSGRLYYQRRQWASVRRRSMPTPPTTRGPAGARRLRRRAMASRSSPGARAVTSPAACGGARRASFEQADSGRLRGLTRSRPTSRNSAGGDSSYAAVAFREIFAKGPAPPVTRPDESPPGLAVRRLVGRRTLTTGPGIAHDQPSR